MIVFFSLKDDAETKVLSFLSSIICADIFRDDLNTINLPDILRKHKDKLFGLTINPVRLQSIRDERRSNSGYASIDQCRKEVNLAEDMFVQNQVPFIDTSNASIEEIAGRILNKTKLKRRY